MYHHLVLEHTHHSYSLAKATLDAQNRRDCSAQGLNSGRNFEKNMWHKHLSPIFSLGLAVCLPLKTKMRDFLVKAKRSAVPKSPVKAPVVMNFKWVRWSFQICHGNSNWQNDIFQAEETYKKWLPNTTTTCPWQNNCFGRVYVYCETLSQQELSLWSSCLSEILYPIPTKTWHHFHMLDFSKFLNRPNLLTPHFLPEQILRFAQFSPWEAVAKAVHEELAYLSPVQCVVHVRQINIWPVKRDHLKRKVLFQPSIFQGRTVNLPGCRFICWKPGALLPVPTLMVGEGH